MSDPNYATDPYRQICHKCLRVVRKNVKHVVLRPWRYHMSCWRKMKEEKCHRCNGSGDTYDGTAWLYARCSSCKGTGRVIPTNEERPMKLDRKQELAERLRDAAETFNSALLDVHEEKGMEAEVMMTLHGFDKPLVVIKEGYYMMDVEVFATTRKRI